MKKIVFTSVILSCLGLVSALAQQKLYINYNKELFTDITVYDAQGNGHPVRALISTATDVCYIDSAFYHSRFSSGRNGSLDYVGAEFGNIRDVKRLTIESLSFGGMSYKEVPTVIAPILDDDYKAVIGVSVLDDQVWKVNMKDSLISRLEKADDGSIAVIECFRGKKKYNQSHLLFLLLKIQGKTFNCVYHSGTNGIAIMEKIKGEPWISEVKEGGDYGTFHYNARHQYRLPNAKVKVPLVKWEITETVKYVPMLGYNCVGNILFDGHTFILDYKKNRILIY